MIMFKNLKTVSSDCKIKIVVMINDRNKYIIRNIYSGRKSKIYVSYSHFIIILHSKGLVYLVLFSLIHFSSEMSFDSRYSQIISGERI